MIIGLLAGGILTGNSLIKAAKYNRLTTNVQKFETAVNVFQDKYQCTPGDCKKATTYWSGATNGNGNNIVQGNPTGSINPPGNCEEFQFWKMLGSGYAGLIEGAYSGSPSAGDCFSGPFEAGKDLPPTPLNEESAYLFRTTHEWGYTLWGKNRNSLLWIGSWDSTKALWNRGTSVISSKDMLLFDKKYDDGIPSSGKILSLAGSYATGTCTTGNPNPDSSSTYTGETDTDCIIVFEVDFIK